MFLLMDTGGSEESKRHDGTVRCGSIGLESPIQSKNASFFKRDYGMWDWVDWLKRELLVIETQYRR
jgi:hypothetical protein